MMIPLDDLLALPTVSEFHSHLGGIYEKSPTFVTQFYNENLCPSTNDAATIQATQARITNVKILFDEIKQYVKRSPLDVQLELLQSHPDLCLKLEQIDAAAAAQKEEKESDITEESRHEQGRAGLSTLASSERNNFTTWNEAYKLKFNIPFILAVRNASKYTVLSALEGRLLNKNSSPQEEIAHALFQVDKIAFMRLLDKVTYKSTENGHGGFLTCHVLDTANGIPAAGMRIELYKYNEDNSNEKLLIETFVTNSDGRLPNGPALKGPNFIVGQYQWIFYVGDYFARFSNSRICAMPFLDEVPLSFGLDDPTDHYHVPLLCSPWSYSTYRGS